MPFIDSVFPSKVSSTKMLVVGRADVLPANGSVTVLYELGAQNETGTLTLY
jgi:hypothetical protein